MPLLALPEAGEYEDFKRAVLDQWANRDKPGRCEKCGLTVFHYIMAGGEAWEQCVQCNRTYLRGHPLRKKTVQESFVDMLMPAMERIVASPMGEVSVLSDKLFSMLGIPAHLMLRL